MPKVTDIAQCKHPNSRKTKALAKQMKKNSTKDKNKFARDVKLTITGNKLAWFKEHLVSDEAHTPKQTAELIIKYMDRYKDELDKIKSINSIGNRKNRQHAGREDIINMTIKREKEEWNGCGIEIPDIMDIHQFTLLKKWNDNINLLQNYKFKRYSKKSLEELENKALKIKQKAENKKTSDSVSKRNKCEGVMDIDL